MSNENNFSFLGIMIWFVAVLFFLYEFFLRVFIGSLAHQIIPDLGLTITAFTLIGSVYHIAYGVMQIPVGLLVDKYGIKKILLVASLICTISTYLFALAQGPALAFFSRFLMGFGSSFAFVCLLVIVATWFNRKHFGFISGLSQFIGTMGPLLAAGPLVNLLMKINGNWRYLLNFVAIAGLLLFVSILFMVRNRPKRKVHDIIQLKSKTPTLMILKKLFTNQQVWFVAIYSAAVYVPLSIIGAIWGTSFLEAHGFSQAAAANFISITWLGYAIGCVCIGIYSDKNRRRKSSLIFCAVAGLIATTSIIYINLSSKIVYELLYFILGVAASGQNIGFAAMAEHVSKDVRASALGFNNAFIVLLNALIQTIAGLLISWMASMHHGQPILHDYTVIFTILPVLYLISAFISIFFIKETFCKTVKEIIILKRLAIA